MTRVLCLLCFVVFLMVRMAEARTAPLFAITGEGEGEDVSATVGGRRLFKLVSNTVVLPYHNGPLLAGAGGLNVYVVWYGAFTPAQKAVVTDFFASFAEGAEERPSVASWWSVTSGYKDSKNNGPGGAVRLAGEVEDNYSKGKVLREGDLGALVLRGEFVADPASVYFLLTAADVEVEGFCMNTCGSHSFTAATAESKNLVLPYAWVGDSGTQCPGQCAWPYALPEYGPQGAKALVAPNADAGMDGMVINIASMLAGVVTNPFNNGYYQGDASAPLEAATACTGIYGAGAYPGNPGELLVDKISGASYNAQGVGSRKYLLPALWDPATLTCTPVP